MRSPLLASLLLTLAGLAPAQVSYFSASLDGGQEVPPNPSTASGWAIVRLQQPANSVRIFAFARGLTASAAHLHLAPVGSNGPVIVPLSPAGGGVWTGNGILTPAQTTSLLAGDTYVNVHTAAFPGGEIRGQVLPPKTTHFLASLDGGQEVPPNNSTATGSAFAALHEPDNRLVYFVETTGLANITAAHIHRAQAGNNGPVIHPLIAVAGAPGTYCGVTDKLSATDLRALQNDGLYFNVHTQAFPGGEIRGQILSGIYDFVASLDGGQEVPPNNSTAIGHACVTLNEDDTISYRVVTQGLVAVTAAHFHNAPAGSNGPVVFPLSGGPTVFSGTTPPLTAAQLADVRAGNWYVNVHTMAFPGGEIRGQVASAEPHPTFGGGCPGSNGRIPEIGADRLACLGGDFDIGLFGATPSRLALITLGSNRDSAGAVPLPVALTSLGFNAPGCFVLVEPGPSATLFTDAAGCASVTIRMRFVPALLAANFFAQWFVFDPGANPAGLVSSNALAITVQ